MVDLFPDKDDLLKITGISTGMLVMENTGKVNINVV